MNNQTDTVVPPSASSAGSTVVVTDPAAAPRARPVARSTRPRESAGKRFFGFLGWIFTGFGLIPALLYRKNARYKAQEVTVYSAHRAFFLWALILTGFVGSALVNHWHNPRVPLVLGWIYLWVLVYTFITVFFDVGTLKLLLWVGIFTLLWVSSKYIEQLKNIHILSGVFAYLKSLHPKLDPGFASVVSWLLLVPWIGALFLTFTNGRKRFTPNEISEWYVGEGSELTDRSGLKFRSRYRDILESVLGFGAGDLIAYDNSHNVIKKYESVLFLAFLWHRLDEILHERSALVDNAAENPVEVEEHRLPASAAK
jgi:hypothetical protein